MNWIFEFEGVLRKVYNGSTSTKSQTFDLITILWTLMVVTQDLAQFPCFPDQDPHVGKLRRAGPEVFLARFPQVKMMAPVLDSPVQLAVLVQGKNGKAVGVNFPYGLLGSAGAEVVFHVLEESIPVLESTLVVEKLQVRGNVFLQVFDITAVEAALKKRTVLHLHGAEKGAISVFLCMERKAQQKQ